MILENSDSIRQRRSNEEEEEKAMKESFEELHVIPRLYDNNPFLLLSSFGLWDNFVLCHSLL